MGEIRIDAPGQESHHWPPYMSNLLEEVVRSWVVMADSGVAAHYLRIGENQPTTEHLRIAKMFLSDRGRAPGVIYYDRNGDPVDLSAWGSV